MGFVALWSGRFGKRTDISSTSFFIVFCFIFVFFLFPNEANYFFRAEIDPFLVLNKQSFLLISILWLVSFITRHFYYISMSRRNRKCYTVVEKFFKVFRRCVHLSARIFYFSMSLPDIHNAFHLILFLVFVRKNGFSTLFMKNRWRSLLLYSW